MATSAAYSIWSKSMWYSSARPAAAMEQALPISAWQPHSAPEMEAFVLMIFPTMPAAAQAWSMSLSEKPSCSCLKTNTAGSTPLAPQVGAVTTTPPPAFSSLTAKA